VSAPVFLTSHAASFAEPDWTVRDHERAEALLAEVQACSDPERRDELRRQAVVLTLDLADGVARRFSGRGMDVEDLVQVGRVARALEGLSDRERLILGLRFVEEQTQSHSGTVLGVSQMQVSRLLAVILGRLRNDLLAPAA